MTEIEEMVVEWKVAMGGGRSGINSDRMAEEDALARLAERPPAVSTSVGDLSVPSPTTASKPAAQPFPELVDVEKTQGSGVEVVARPAKMAKVVPSPANPSSGAGEAHGKTIT
ncbi:hypothetical protein L1987_48728 [Smallanthus sonchifolius]|uniref:Uncharacterized protein n=1 Tax=Smallanthus sonchifolius TaxID=185202 RepID=A0ACB9FTS7_9ASTR|nr:hypothetical protein L1987_48728 [Smallanthus sonchifolius]